MSQRPLWTIAEIARATGGRLVGLEDGPVADISIDSREIAPTALFVAIKGETHDGHDFVPKALDAGAAAALVSEAYAAAHADAQKLIVVADPLEGLRALARAARTRNRGTIVAVTGSAGKTTTKEAIRTVLGALGSVHYSIKSFNNHWGVPLMLARLPEDAQYGVFELGMNHAGEITALVKLVRPHIALITTVAAAHLEFFNSVAEIAAAKAEILYGIEPGGTALLNTDHEYLHILFAHARNAGVGQVVTYGFDESADWRIVPTRLGEASSTADLVHGEEVVKFVLNVPGRHMLANGAAAIAVAALLGDASAVPVAVDALSRFGAPEGRGLTQRFGPAERPFLLVDESYNANVASLRAALDVYMHVSPPGGVKRLVLGDMLEMGPQGPELAAGFADAVLSTGARDIVLVGPVMKSLADALAASGAPSAHRPLVRHVEAIEEIADKLVAELAYGDALMVKGSKGVRLATLVKSIRKHFEDAGSASGEAAVQSSASETQ